MIRNTKDKLLLLFGYKPADIDKIPESEKQEIINHSIIFTDYKLLQSKKIKELLEKIK